MASGIGYGLGFIVGGALYQVWNSYCMTVHTV